MDNQLMFVDEMIISTKAEEESITEFMKDIECLKKFTILKINVFKSNIYLSGSYTKSPTQPVL